MMFGTHTDITRLKKVEAELERARAGLERRVRERTEELSKANKGLSEANAKLSKMYEELSALDHAKNDFMAHINHELRTPLNGILGYTSLLEESIRPEGKDYLQSINTLVSRLIKVAEISLLLVELRTVDDKINIRKIVLDDVIQRVLPSVDAERKNIEIKVENIPADQLVSVEPRLLLSCFTIILDNSIKYSPINGIIQLTGRDNNPYFSIEISDNGPGFSSEALANLFEPFSADNLEYKSHGFGLGLATAKKLSTFWAA
ncbi:MAG: HAMP domain-containing histidine kinase, partial [Oscillatoriales cyanobacterium RM1_1_9]|nr:HAMP domain-containing histidine kinase [Oscillatoriales cyanobacterium RM1_1_9]